MGVVLGIIVGGCITLFVISAILGYSVLYDTDTFIESVKEVKRRFLG